MKGPILAKILIASLSVTTIAVGASFASKNSFTLTATPQPNSNSVYLDWALPDESNKTYKVFQKKEGSNAFQSISSTNLNNGKQVKVLNIHPNVGETISFTTWDGEHITVPKSASLKQWMEEPNAESSKGYGRGIIEVASVTAEDYNAQPDLYLKDSSGSYKYDVIMFGSWDSNAGKDLSQLSADATARFLDSGRGALFGHDTVRRGAFPYFFQLQRYINSGDYTRVYNGNAATGGFDYGLGSSNVVTSRYGLLTNYPWLIGEVGTKLTVPGSHNSQSAQGDIWLRYSHSAYTEADMSSTSNHYLSTWNNTAMIQTGHSSGAATPDEQKLLANTLFYLNQLSTETYLTDNSAQDLKAPTKPSIRLNPSSSNQLSFNFDGTIDRGSSYEYYVEAESKTGGKQTSNTVSTTITTGIKGYSYVLDTNPKTIPNNTVNHTSNDLVINNINSEGNYYLHIKAIDKNDNASEVVHYKINTSKAKAPIISASRNNWGKTNVTFELAQEHNKNVKILSISSSASQGKPVEDRLRELGYNVTYMSNISNPQTLLNYDIVLADYTYWGVSSAESALLNQAYNLGANIISIGNDVTNNILPVEETIYADHTVDLSARRVSKNEASYFTPSFEGNGDRGSNLITRTHPQAKVWYTTPQGTPNIVHLTNGTGEWIHSQLILGYANTKKENELIMGFVDYLSKSISEPHVKEVEYKINNGGWVPYNGEVITVETEGFHTVSTRNVDNRGVASNISSVSFGIDNSAPSLVASAPSTTSSRNTRVYLDNIYDALSGVDKVRVSNFSDFRDGSGFVSVKNLTTKAIDITLPMLPTPEENYSKRTIYVQLLDNVGNSFTTTCSTVYEPSAPKKPVITTPKNNSLIRNSESCYISWLYTSGDGDITLPQSKAIVTVRSTDGSSQVYNVAGNKNTLYIPPQIKGIHSVTVTVFNSFGKSATSDALTLRCDSYLSSGTFSSKPILPGQPVSYIAVKSIAEIPKNTSVTGYIYYADKKDASFSEAQKIPFTVTESSKMDLIRLPKPSNKVKVIFNLNSFSKDDTVSPSLDDIIVYGR